MRLQGWGRRPTVEASVLEPANLEALRTVLGTQQTPVIARGCGRSYGDSSLAEHVIGTRLLDNFLAFDAESGLLACEGGVTLEQILAFSVPKGWFLPVLPGTRFVSVGGAIASDVHGKNHHRDGCFSRHVQSIDVLLATGELVACSRETNSELFRATCAGMGLTGIIASASLQLARIQGPLIDQQTLVAANLDEAFSLFEQHPDASYSVAWLDSLAGGGDLGRSLVYLGEHVSDGDLAVRRKPSLAMPLESPGFLLNRFTIGAFNRLIFHAGRRAGRPRLHYEDYFFPLDRIRHWNRLYGRAGFMQYQLVVPMAGARQAIRDILVETSRQGKGSFLTVLKKLGPRNANYLSFPLAGYTLALDFKYEPDLPALLERLDRIVLEHQGRIYLSKDARMSAATFRQSYPDWEIFMALRHRYDPQNRFASLQSKRLGLTD